MARSGTPAPHVVAFNEPEQTAATLLGHNGGPPLVDEPWVYDVDTAGAMAGLSRSGSYSAAYQGHIPVIRFGRLKKVPGELWRRMLRGEVLPVITRSEMAAQRPALPDAASRGESSEHSALIRRSRKRHVRGEDARSEAAVP
jgi:hypothetical protein